MKMIKTNRLKIHKRKRILHHIKSILMIFKIKNNNNSNNSKIHHKAINSTNYQLPH